MKPLLLLTIMALPSAIWQTACSAGETPYVIFEDDFDSDSDGPAALCQFNGNSDTAPFNVQVKEFGSKDIRVRARVMVTQSNGHVGLCVRSDAADNARGLNLRIQPGNPGLRLYNNDSPLAQTCTHGTATDFAINTWYTVDLQVEGDQLIGRLYDDYNGRTLLEQVEVTLRQQR